jgi:hypothetical protein
VQGDATAVRRTMGRSLNDDGQNLMTMNSILMMSTRKELHDDMSYITLFPKHIYYVYNILPVVRLFRI